MKSLEKKYSLDRFEINGDINEITDGLYTIWWGFEKLFYGLVHLPIDYIKYKMKKR